MSVERVFQRCWSLLVALAVSACFHIPADIAPSLDLASDSTRARDTLFVLHTTGITIMARRIENLPEATPLIRAAHAYERMFGITPSTVLMYLSDSTGGEVVDPPSATDTVIMTTADEYLVTSSRRDSELGYYAAYAASRAWVRAALAGPEPDERAPLPDVSDPVVTATWLEVGVALVIGFDDSSRRELMQASYRSLDILSVKTLLRDDAPAIESLDTYAALAVQWAAFVEFLRDFYPQTLSGLPGLLRRGMRSEVALASLTKADLTAINEKWRDWFAFRMKESEAGPR